MIGPWREQDLFGVPAARPAEGFNEPGVEAVFLDGPPWRGRATRIFAWIARPALNNATAAPAVVLVHGGGGTAFAHWARAWANRGCFAVAMDTCGCTAGGEHQNRPRHEHGGPPSAGSHQAVNQPPEDQWLYHAVAAVTRSRSFIASKPGVDASRIGLAGISWGAVIGATAASLDPGFAAVSLVYGCGFADLDLPPTRPLHALTPAQRARWMRLWDPSNYLGRLTTPASWVSGATDFAFHPAAHRASHRLAPGTQHVCMKPAFEHGHPQGETVPESIAFLEHHLLDGPPTIRALRSAADGRRLTATFSRPPRRAWLVHTADRGWWHERRWQTTEATVDNDTVAADAPPDATAAYLHVEDDRDLEASGELVTFD